MRTERGALFGTALLAALGVVLLGFGLAGIGGTLVAVGVVGAIAVAVGPAARPTVHPDDVLVPRPNGRDRTGLAAADRRLLAALGDPAVFDGTVAPQLVVLARDRLARRGVDVDTDPEQARALLGEPLWSLVAQERSRSTDRDDRDGPPRDTARPQRPRDLAELVTRIEAL